MNSSQANTVDVILPFHRIDSFLLDAIDSVMKSADIDVHIFLVRDDANGVYDYQSLNKLLNHLEENQYNFTLVSNRKGGYANAFEVCRLELTAPYVALMNSDDLVSKDRFSIQRRVLVESEAQICVARLIKFRGQIENYVPFMTGDIGWLGFSVRTLLCGPYGADATWFMCRNTFLEHFYMDPSIRAGDWMLALELSSSITFVFASEAKYFYRVHTQQVTAQKIQHRSVFDEIYSQWVTTNRSLGLPHLEVSDAALIASPTSRIQLTSGWRKRIHPWIEMYSTLFCREEWLIVKQILFRRYVLRGKFPPLSLCSANNIFNFVFELVKFQKAKFL